MTISWYGENCFKLQSGETTVLTDPFGSETGLSAPRIKADVVLKTIAQFPSDGKEGSESFVIAGPGEYDVEGVLITGIELFQESAPSFVKTVYTVRMEEISFCFLGYVSESPESTALEKIDLAGVDVLFFPVGRSKESPFMEPKSILQLVKNLEPKIAIPTLYQIPGLKRKALPLENFVSELHGKKEGGIETVEKLTLKKKDLGEIKNTKFVAFKA